MSTYPDFEVEQRGEQPYVGVTRSVTMIDFAPVADQIAVILGWLAERDISPGGAPFFRYRVIDMERELVVQAGVPLFAPLPGTAGFEADVLPAGRYVTTTYHGHPDDLVEVTGRLLSWADAQALTFDQHSSADGDVWGSRLEFYETNPLEVPDRSHWRTTLAFRLAD